MNRITFHRAVVVITIVYWASMLVATHLPPRRLPNTHVNDKVEHFVGYGALTIFLHLSNWRRNVGGSALAIFCVVLIYGALDELTQPPFGRTCDIRDWFADARGTLVVGIVMIAVRLFLRRRARGAPTQFRAHV